MTKIPVSAATEEPLVSDELIEQRVHGLIGRACRRQLWLLFLTDDHRQVPVLLPTADFPGSPEPEYVRALVRAVADILETAGATQLIVVWERYAGADLTPADRAWARAVADECLASGVRMRAQLLSSKRGVRWIAPDDYLD